MMRLFAAGLAQIFGVNLLKQRVLVAFAAFLCFFSVVYVNCLQKGKAYEDDLIMQLHYQNAIVSTRCGDLMYTLQNTPVEKENPGQREEAYGWCNVTDNVSAGHIFDRHRNISTGIIQMPMP